MAIIMQVGAANAAAFDRNGNLAGPGRGGVARLDAEVLLLLDEDGFHVHNPLDDGAQTGLEGVIDNMIRSAAVTVKQPDGEAFAGHGT